MVDSLAELLQSVPPEFLVAGNRLPEPRTGQIHRARVDLAPCPEPPPAGLILVECATAAVSLSNEPAPPRACIRDGDDVDGSRFPCRVARWIRHPPLLLGRRPHATSAS